MSVLTEATGGITTRSVPPAWVGADVFLLWVFSNVIAEAFLCI